MSWRSWSAERGSLDFGSRIDFSFFVWIFGALAIPGHGFSKNFSAVAPGGFFRRQNIRGSPHSCSRRWCCYPGTSGCWSDHGNRNAPEFSEKPPWTSAESNSSSKTHRSCWFFWKPKTSQNYDSISITFNQNLRFIAFPIEMTWCDNSFLDKRQEAQIPPGMQP